MSDHAYQPETLAIHAGQIPDAATGARALPIYQTTSFVFDSADHAASLFNLQTFGNVYSRLSNPTVAALEERVAALEGGRAAVASASGMAAEAMALMTILQAGDHVVAAGALYGGTVTMLAVNLAKFGIETSFVDATDPAAFAAAMRPNTRAVFAESLGNPSLAVLDIEAVADVAHTHGVPLIVDNTVPSPFLCNPLRFGADIRMPQCLRFLNNALRVLTPNSFCAALIARLVAAVILAKRSTAISSSYCRSVNCRLNARHCLIARPRASLVLLRHSTLSSCGVA